MPRIVLALLPLLIVAAAGCGGDDPSSSTDGEKADASATPEAVQTQTEPTGAVEVAKISKDLGAKPAIPKPDGSPPAELQKFDIVRGKGPRVKKGDKLTMQYVGVTWTRGEEFDTSWGKAPFEVTIGTKQVIAGWDQGIIGMRKGGRRTLVIPPELGYGDQGSGQTILPGETLIFVVDLLEIG